MPIFVLAAGCGEQDAPDYLGETLGVLQGTLESDLPQPPPAADLMLSWPDYSTATDGVVPLSTFQRIELAPTFPAQFSAQLIQPPPDSAYTPPDPDAWVASVGPRTAIARIMLVKHGESVAADAPALSPDYTGPVLANFDNYLLFYAETTGWEGIKDDDGTVHPVYLLARGYHLWRQDRTYCSLGVDQACLDKAGTARNGPPTAWDVYQCSNVTQASVNYVEVPIATPITLTVEPLDKPPTFTSCPPQSS